MACPYHKDGRCSIAEHLADDEPVQVDAETCARCRRDAPPQQANRTTANAAIRHLRRVDQAKLHERLPLIKKAKDGQPLASAAQEATAILLRQHQSPGDLMTLTAAIHSIHAAYPGRWTVDVSTSCDAIFEHNPGITTLRGRQRRAALWIDMQYPSIHRSDDVLTPFLAGFVRFLADQLQVPIPLATNRPHLYLSDEEQGWMSQVAELAGGKDIPYWIVNAGVKQDFTAKQWPVEYYQEVIDQTRGRIQWVQVGESHHNHPDLRGVIDLRGQTDARQLIRLVYHSRGGLGPVTFLQHLCAAWEKPYICLLGGREPVTWVQYPLQHTLHTIGQLPCCQARACWKSRVVPLGDGDEKDTSLCDQPSMTGVRPVAGCMARITPRMVLDVLSRTET